MYDIQPVMYACFLHRITTVYVSMWSKVAAQFPNQPMRLDMTERQVAVSDEEHAEAVHLVCFPIIIASLRSDRMFG
jgi:hypothetical protein